MMDKARTWSLRNRLLWLLDEKMGGQVQLKPLEAATGIKATHWRDFAAGKQRPTVEMIEAACRMWPQHAFWLATGITDAQHGHTAPYDGNFPYRAKQKETPAKFFGKAIETLDACIEAFDADADFGHPDIQGVTLLRGFQRSAHQLGLPATTTRKLKKLFQEMRELDEARSQEQEITEVQPRESYRETEIKLPERLLKLKSTKQLSNSTVESLESQLAAERERLERHRRVEQRLSQTTHGNKKD